MRCCHHNVVGAKPVWKFVSQCFVFLLAVALIQILVYYGRTLKDHSVFKSSKRIEHLGQRTSTLPGRQKRPSHGFKPSLELGERVETFQIGDERIGFVDLPTRTPMSSICDDDTDILIFVLTTPENRFFRRQLRRVWANKCYLGLHGIRSVMLMGLHPQLARLSSNRTRAPLPNTVVEHPDSRRLRVTHRGFVVNASVVHESYVHGDVVMIDYPESYQNLTYKVAAGFQWAHRFCPQATFVGKVDDDVFLGVDRLMRYLQGREGGKKVIGAHNMVYTPARWNASRWYVTYDDYRKKIYPPYANGFTYFLTQDYIRDMMRFLEGKRLLPVEDVFLTGIVADAIGAERVYSFLDWMGNCTFDGDCSFLGRWLNKTDASYMTGPISVLCFDTNYDEFARQKLAAERLQRFSKRLGLVGWPFE